MVWFGDTDKDWLGAGCFIPGGAWGETAQAGAARKVGRGRRAEQRVVTGHTDTSGTQVSWSGGMSVIIKLIDDIRIP